MVSVEELRLACAKQLVIDECIQRGITPLESTETIDQPKYRRGCGFIYTTDEEAFTKSCDMMLIAFREFIDQHTGTLRRCRMEFAPLSDNSTAMGWPHGTFALLCRFD